MRDLRYLDGHRAVTTELECYGTVGGAGEGMFLIKSETTGAGLGIVASSGGGWDHVSVSLDDRTPTWAEMEQVKRAFFEDHETAMQLHVPPSEHISMHPFALHLFRPQNEPIPRPPGWMVGLKAEKEPAS